MVELERWTCLARPIEFSREGTGMYHQNFFCEESNMLSRRKALFTLGVGATYLPAVGRKAFSTPAPSSTKPILGSWFEFQHHSPVEGVPWNPALADFTCQQWEAKIREISEIGMEYLVLLCTAVHFKAFFPTRILPKYELKCPDPLESVLSAADKYHIKFFIGGGFYGEWTDPHIITDPVASQKRLLAIEELAKRYGHHPSFYGWYWPNEAEINPYYSEEFIGYVNTCSKLARSLSPKLKIMIAPYGTRVAKPDDEYVRQLDKMDVDIVAYQDEVGVRKSKVSETSAFYEGLRKAHNRASKARIWADVEVFEFEGKVYDSALLPASFERVQKQLEAVSPWVDTILIYQYQGMMNKPGSSALAGPPASTRLYSDYVSWLKDAHPMLLKKK
jgi:hypothetical protein